MTEPTTETARAVLLRHGLSEDVIDGVLCLHAQELAALQRLRMDELDLTGQKARLVGRIVDLIDPMLTPASAVPLPPVDQTVLRDRIADAMRAHYLCLDRAEADADGNMPCRCGNWREAGLMGSDEEDWNAHLADAVLAVLHAPADRAAILRAEAEWIVEHCPEHGCVEPATEVCHCEIAERLRRLADESPLSPYYEHSTCGFHWHGRDGVDIPMRDGQPVCPRCELAEAERTRTDQAAALGRFRVSVHRLAAHAVGFQDALDESDRGPWGKTVGADITELRRLVDETATTESRLDLDALERVRERCQAVRDRVGPGGMINASQILGLLSPTWPDGNFEGSEHAAGARQDGADRG